jgi:hypothetical protein
MDSIHPLACEVKAAETDMCPHCTRYPGIAGNTRNNLICAQCRAL